MKYTIANVSCGKDSLAMVEEHIKRGRQLDEVVMYDTGMEFQAIYDTWAKLTARLDEIGIKHTVLYPAYPFRWDMLERLVTRRDGSGTYRRVWMVWGPLPLGNDGQNKRDGQVCEKQRRDCAGGNSGGRKAPDGYKRRNE